MPEKFHGAYFELFNEIGIIEQLSRALFEARLPKGLLVSHFSILNHLVRVSDGRTPLELARAFQVAKTTMTHSLSVLEKHAFVETRPNPMDKRSKQVWITAKGRNFREDAIGFLVPDISDLATHYDITKVQQLVPLLAELRKILDERRG